MRFWIVLSVFLFIEVVFSVFFLTQAGSAEDSLSLITELSRRLCLFVFSFIFLWQHQQSLLTKVFSAQYYLLFSSLFLILLGQLVVLTLWSGYQPIPYRIALYVLATTISLALPAIQYLHVKSRIKNDIFPIAQQLFAYLVWMLFFAFYYSQVEKGYSAGVTAFRINVIILAWISLLMGYRISRIFRATLPSEKRRQKGSS